MGWARMILASLGAMVAWDTGTRLLLVVVAEKEYALI